MPVGNASPRSPVFSDVPEEFTARGAFALPWTRPFRCFVSYAVPIGLGILTLWVVVSTFRVGGTADLPPSAAAATAFWASGWVVQALAFFSLRGLVGLRTPWLRLGLLGVETSPQKCLPWQAFVVSVGTVVPILLLGMFYRLVEGGFQMPVLEPADTTEFMPPSIGFKQHESIWLTGAWLCWFQAVLQMVPFSRTPGRQLLSGMVVAVGRVLPESMQLQLFRRMLIVLASAIMLLSLPLMFAHESPWSASWPWLALAAVFLWISSRSDDIPKLIQSMQPSESDLESQVNQSWLASLREYVAEHRRSRQLNRALRKERDEAADVQRLDEILNRLHREGVDSLSQEDRRILDRVSQNLRRERNPSDSAE